MKNQTKNDNNEYFEKSKINIPNKTVHIEVQTSNTGLLVGSTIRFVHS